MKVVIVDDDAELAHLLKLSLQVGFYAKAKALAREHLQLTDCLEVEQFSDAPTALQYLRNVSESVDLIFLEINAPGMDGFEFIKTCRSECSGKYGEIVVVTDRGHKQDIKEALLAGAKDYILKPFEPEELMEHVFHAWRQNGCAVPPPGE
jgi:two-component system chemotaxis response regulator CheY